MSEPVVLDGVGRIWLIDQDGTLKYVDEKVNSVIFSPNFTWTKVFGGQSGYAFHLTAQDLQDAVSIEVPRYSPALAEIFQGAETFEGQANFDENEEGVLGSSGYTLENISYGGTLVDGSESVYLKGTDGKLTKLAKAASAPTATQYLIAANVITSNASNNGKNIIVTYKRLVTNATKNGFTGVRKPRMFKFVHRFELTNDRTGLPVQAQLTIYKAIGGGQMNIGAARKTPSVNTMQLEIMDGDKTAENPKGYAAELIFQN